MRRLVFSCLLVLFLGLLSGCVKGEFHVTVNKDDSGSVDAKMAFNSMLLGLMSEGEDPLSEMKASMEEQGFVVSNYRDGELVGVQGKKEFKNIQDFKGLNDMFGDGEAPIVIEKGLFTKTYRIDTNIDMREMASTEGDPDMAGMENMMLNSVDIRFLVTLPVDSENHNATNTSDEGKTMEWQLTAGEDNKMTLTASSLNTTTIVIAVLIAVAVVIGILVVVIRKKRKAEEASL